MPVLRIKNMLPDGEKFTLSVDGVPQAGTSFTVPETFRLRIEQYRLSTSGAAAAGALGAVLAVFAAGGRAGWGSEAASPYYAVWEGTCLMLQDGEIELWLREEGREVRFEPRSRTVSFQSVDSRTEGREPSRLGRWAVINVPPLLFLSAICLVLFFGAGVFGIDPSQDSTLWVLKSVFLIFPPYMLFHVWKSALRPFLKKEEIPLEDRMPRRLAVQAAVTALLAGAAAFEILSFWVLDFPPAMLTAFPATAVLIAHLSATGSFLDQIRRSGVRDGALEAGIRRSRGLRAAACAAYAVIVLALILKLAAL